MGGGDSRGGLIHSLLKGMEPQEAIEFAWPLLPEADP